MLVLLAVLLGVAFLIIVAYLIYIHNKYDHIPGPKRDNFFLGNLPTIWRRRAEGEALYPSLLRWVKAHGHTYRMCFAHKVMIFTCDPEAIKEIYTTGPDFPKPADPYEKIGYTYGIRLVGHGIFSQIDEDKYRHQRNILNPAFTKHYLESMLRHYNEVADTLIDNLIRAADGKTVVQMYDKVQKTTLDVIAKVAYNKEINALENDHSDFVHAFHMMTDGMSDSVNGFFVPFLLDRKVTKSEFAKATKYLRNTGKEWLMERCGSMEAGHYVPDDALTLWIKAWGLSTKHASDPETMELIIDDYMTVFFAGHHTTSIGMSFAVQEIGRNPEIYKKLREEVDTVLGSKSFVSSEDLIKMEYLNQVFQESLRYWDPIPWLFRTNVNETSFEGYKIPPWSNIVVSPFVSGRVPEFYPNVDVFDPERFAPGSPNMPSKYVFFPFALGHRNCLGQNAAKLESRVVLAKIIQRLNFQLDMTQSFDCYETFLLEPRDGVRCTITLRE